MVKIKMNFPSSVFCNNAGKNVLDKRIREALQKLNKNWNFCINTVEGRSRASPNARHPTGRWRVWSCYVGELQTINSASVSPPSSPPPPGTTTERLQRS